jgi:putative transposase
LIESAQPQLSVRRQCDLLGLNRASFYYTPAPVAADDLELMRLLDQQYTRTPFYGRRRMTIYLRQQGYQVNPKRVRRLLQVMGLEAIYPKPRTTVVAPNHKIYPYLLRGVAITHPNQVWSTDITYIPMCKGFMYLVAVMDWYSRYVLTWELSNTLDGNFCLQALQQSLTQGRPEIFNTDQGAQFTAHEFTATVERAEVRVSMDGRGRALDNIFVERLWRNVKYEDVYLKKYETVSELYTGLTEYFRFYNHERPHQSLAYRVPSAVYFNTYPL